MIAVHSSRELAKHCSPHYSSAAKARKVYTAECHTRVQRDLAVAARYYTMR
jgi:hypothetical protein